MHADILPLEMDKKTLLLVKNKWRFTAIGTSGALVTTGLFAWKLYCSVAQSRKEQQDKHSLTLNQENLTLDHQDSSEDNDLVYHELIDNKSQYIAVPKNVLDNIGQFEEIEISPPGTKEDFKSMIPKHLRKHWRLLHQANTGEYEQHIKAVKELSKASLSEGELVQLAQSCSCRAAVGLARSAGVDLRLFCRPPPLPPDMREREIVEMFQEILTSLPGEEELHSCIRYFTTTALEQYLTNSDEAVLDNDISCEFHRESHHIHSIPRPSVSQDTIIEHCLLALLSLSTVEEQCRTLITSCVLPLFTLVVDTFPDNAQLKSLIGKILANLSLYPANLEPLFKSGWVGLLASWKQSSNLVISLPAIKALSNMDQQFSKHLLQPGVYLLLPSDRHVQHLNQLSNWGVDVVFVHGLWGGVFFTWRQQDPHNMRGEPVDQVSEETYSYCWPRDWLAEDSTNVRVLACDFDSYISQWGPTCPTQNFQRSLEERSEDLLDKLREAGVGTRPVIFVGHSMGGLIIKKMLVSAQNSGELALRRLAEKTKGVVFYSTPHFGSQIAKMNSVMKYFFFPSVEVQELEMDSPTLLDLNNFFKEFVVKFGTKVISFGEAIPCRQLGMDFTFVPVESSNPGVGEYFTVPFNHMDICKPLNRKSILFRKFYNLLWDAVDEEIPYE